MTITVATNSNPTKRLNIRMPAAQTNKILSPQQSNVEVFSMQHADGVDNPSEPDIDSETIKASSLGCQSDKGGDDIVPEN